MTDGSVVVVVVVVVDTLFDFSFATSLFLMFVVVIDVNGGFLSVDDLVTAGRETLFVLDGKSCRFVRVVVGPRIVDVLQTLGCDVIDHGGLGRVVVADVCAAENVKQNNY